MHDRFGKAIIIGDACVDVTVPLTAILADTDRPPEDSALMPGLGGGGTSANTAAALAKLGVGTSFMGTLGADFGGRYIRKEFEELGIDTSMTLTDDTSNTVYVFAFIDKSGERKLWAFPRTEMSYINYDLSRIDMELIRTASWVHASGMTIMFDGSLRRDLPLIFRTAHEAGVPTSFDLNTRVQDPAELDEGIRSSILETIPYVSYLLGSARDEFYSFCPKDDWRDSVRSFAAPGRTVIARLGGEGSLMIEDGRETEEPALRIPVVNTTGAGDAFNAGFIAGKLRGLRTDQAVVMAHAVAGYKISRGGARQTPDMEELRGFAREQGLTELLSAGIQAI